MLNLQNRRGASHIFVACKNFIIMLLMSYLYLGAMTTISSAENSANATTKKNTLSGKLIVGYQGWFGCPGDAGLKFPFHWQDGETIAVPMLPDVSEIDPTQLCDSEFKDENGKPIKIFSSANPAITAKHLEWTKKYGIDIIALQRFVVYLKNKNIREFANNVRNNFARLASKRKTSYFIMYDLSGSSPADAQLIQSDLREMIEQGYLKDPSYAQAGRGPIIGLWGLGFKGRPWTVDAAKALIKEIRSMSPNATIMLGVPAWWRSGTRDASADREWMDVYAGANIISPWTISRYHDAGSLKSFITSVVKDDVSWAQSHGINYLPVVFPGTASLHKSNNLANQNKNIPAMQPGIDTSRDCGRFLNEQAAQFYSVGLRNLYVAMFDELNEGTAIFKLRTQDGGTWRGIPLALPDGRNCNGASDQYLKIMASIKQMLARTSKQP